jgi:hypothetical protein
MKNYSIEYLSYEGNVRHTYAVGNDEDEAINNAYDSEGNYSGDNIYKIISVEEGDEVTENGV